MNAFLVVISCMAAVGIAAHGLLLRRLRTHHGQLWQELGSPRLILDNSIRNGVAVQARLRSGFFESLGDPLVARLSRFLRWLGLVYVVCFGVLLVFAIYARSA